MFRNNIYINIFTKLAVLGVKINSVGIEIDRRTILVIKVVTKVPKVKTEISIKPNRFKTNIYMTENILPIMKFINIDIYLLITISVLVTGKDCINKCGLSFISYEKGVLVAIKIKVKVEYINAIFALKSSIKNKNIGIIPMSI